MPSFYPPRADSVIEASLEAVWACLLDTRGYPRWNRFIPEARGNPLNIGERIDMRVVLGGREVAAVMRSVRIELPLAGRALWIHEHASWLARFGLVRSTRYHELSVPLAGRVRYQTWEYFSGLLKPFVPFPDIDAGFKQQAADLKRACEAAAAK